MLNIENYIDIETHEPSEKHKRMSINNRSAQFAPFKSLSGYEEEIKEKARILQTKKELSSDQKEIINNNIISSINELVEIEYFVKITNKKD